MMAMRAGNGGKRIDLRAMVRPTQPWELKEREPNGRYKRENVDDIIAVAVDQRIRNGVHPSHVRDQRAGYLFGRLVLEGSITDEQFSVGQRWGSVAAKYMGLVLPQRPHPKSPSWGSVGGANGIGEETYTPEAIARIRKDYDDAFDAVTESFDGHRYMRAMKEVIVYQRMADLGLLRCGLNILARLWRDAR